MKRVLKTHTVAFLLFLAISSLCLGSAFALQLSEIKLAPGDAPVGAEFGRSIAITGDLLAVGAGGATAGSIGKAGAVYLYKRQGQAYVREAKLIAPDATPGAEFGRAVAIQGNTVAVGARFAQVGTLTSAGAAYVFRKVGGSWYLEAKIASPTPANGDNFGRALAIQGDLLAVTARKEKDQDPDQGAAYVFRRTGGSWTLEAKLTASDPMPSAYFGQSVTVQGDLIVVGARNADPNGAGAIYLFCRSGDQWVQIAKLFPLDGKPGDQFAFTVGISGNLIAVGARRADSDAGAAYLFALTGEGAVQVAKLTASDATGGDEFGQSIGMTGDTLAVGAWRADIGGTVNQGAVYLFRRMGNDWVQVAKRTASDGAAYDEFGFSLSTHGNLMAVGASSPLPDGSNAGAAYVMPLRP